ncbi:pyrethroid hydrolase Ces2a-like [Panulirus ornatus]|uniref:pyrethroid hydrolase Ces2a-like n=1 Tax=Panulirus ornatus TaxID=150431 RepID=UPI003A8AD862
MTASPRPLKLLLLGLVLLLLATTTTTTKGDEGRGRRRKESSPSYASVRDTVEVQLKQGKIFVAREESGQGRRPFYSFKGIPYARPPVGDLRFRDPVAAGGWTGPRNGSFDPPLCPQPSLEGRRAGVRNVSGDEDCLYLNVYTPKKCVDRRYPSEAGASGLPVMVWLHGGGFVFGGVVGYPPLPLLTRDVVLVVLQYRLAVLGFLSTEDSVLPGNLGLKDQTLALRWVQDNIREFGGDPDKVTLAGQSSGADSVHYQVLTPKAKGLFKRAILQSGTSLCPLALGENHRQMAMALGERLNCTDADPHFPGLGSAQLLSCLQQVPMEELVLAFDAFAVWRGLPRVWLPRVDGDYVPDHPAVLVRSGRFNRVSLITGVTQHEGASQAIGLTLNKPVAEALRKNFSVIGPLTLNFHSEESSLYLTSRAYYHYLGEIKITEDKIEDFVQLLTADVHICHENTASLHTAFGDPVHRVFKYELQHHGQHSLADRPDSPFNGSWVAHSDDIQYLFDPWHAYPQQLERPADIFVREVMLTLWTNFAATGNPTPDGSLGFRWWPTTESHQWYLALTTSPTMKDDTPVEELEFWRNMPTKMNKLLFPERFVVNTTRPSPARGT